MGSSAASLSSLNALLKEHWDEIAPAAAKAFYDDVPLLSLIEKKTTATQGEAFIFPIQKNSNFGVGARARTLNGSTTTPSPGSAEVAQGSLDRKTYYARMRIFATGIDAAMRDGSIWDTLNFQMNDTMRSLRRVVDYDLYGDGTGSLTTHSSGAAGTVKTVASTRAFQEGETIVFASSTGTSAVSGTISTIDSETQVTLTGSVDTTGLTNVFRSGVTSGTADNYNNAIAGLANVISDSGTYAGINRATAGNSYWKAVSVDGSSGLTLDLMADAFFKVNAKAGGKPDLILCNPVHYRQYAALMYPDRRWQSEEKTFDGGFSGLEFTHRFGKAKLLPTHECPTGKMFFIDTSSMKLLVEHDFGVRRDGDNIMQLNQDYDYFTGLWVFSAQLACHNCAKNGVITSLPVS